MHILHLFSNHKWTGPAEPALNLCLELRRRGIDLDFACSPKGICTDSNKIVAVAQENGLDPLNFLWLGKHRHPVWNFLDANRLRKHVQHYHYSLIHCHLDNDHEIACRALRSTPLPVVRSNHLGTGLPDTRRNRFLMSHTAALFEASGIALARDAGTFGIDKKRLHLIPGAIATERFDPSRSLPDMRATLGLPEEAFVVGIVARMQTHRHYEDLFEGFAKFSSQTPQAHLVVIGRGTRQEQVGFEPIRRFGLEGRVHFTGYLEGDAYVGALNTFDVGIFLTPGTDGTCRATREMMAMNKAMIVADRGMLREIVEHEAEGLVTDGSAEQLCAAMKRLHASPNLLRAFSQKAFRKAHSQYTLEHLATRVIQAYETILK